MAPTHHRYRRGSPSIVFDRGGGVLIFRRRGGVLGGIEWDGSMDRASYILQKMVSGAYPKVQIAKRPSALGLSQKRTELPPERIGEGGLRVLRLGM